MSRALTIAGGSPVGRVIGIVLRAAAGIDLEALPFTGSPPNHTVRELRHRRQELSGQVPLPKFHVA